MADIQQRRVELVQGRAPWTVRSLISLAASNSAAGTAIVGYALLAAAALLRCVLAGTPLSKPALEDRVAEGAILGAGSLNLRLRGEVLECVPPGSPSRKPSGPTRDQKMPSRNHGPRGPAPETARFLRDELREARAVAARDAESFAELVVAIERVGAVACGRAQSLGMYRDRLTEMAGKSALSAEIPDRWSGWHTPFDALYRLVQDGRNDAVHQGAQARALTEHAVQLALVLEDALMTDAGKVRDFMVRDVAWVEMEQPLSSVRQVMLVKSFSFVPLLIEDRWRPQPRGRRPLPPALGQNGVRQ